MGCGRRAVQHPRIPRAVADLLRARHDRRDAMARRHITDMVAACSGQKQFCKGPAHRRPGCSLSWARLFCDGLALTDLTMFCASRPREEVLQGVAATELLSGPIQTPHAGHVDCVRGWRLTGSRHVWCAEVLSEARKWWAMSCRHMLQEASPNVLDQNLCPVLLAGGVRGLVRSGPTARQPFGGATR